LTKIVADVEFGPLIGRGAFANVYKGNFDGKDVAQVYPRGRKWKNANDAERN